MNSDSSFIHKYSLTPIHNPYPFLYHLLHMSSSDTDTDTDPDTPSPLSGHFPVASQPIVMVSPPDSQDTPKDSALPHDVFHTPPEGSSLHSSDVDVCPVNLAVDPDAATFGFADFCDAPHSVDLGKDSELGFSDVVQFRDCRGVESNKVKEGMEQCTGNHVTGDDVGVNSDKVACTVAGKCKGKLVSENDWGFNSVKVARIVEANKSSGGGVEEDSGMQKKSDEGLRVLPTSLRGCMENAASVVEDGSSREKMNVFDVFKAVAEISNDEDEVYLSNISLLDLARARGMTLPRSRWYPKEFNYPPK